VLLKSTNAFSQKADSLQCANLNSFIKKLQEWRNSDATVRYPFAEKRETPKMNHPLLGSGRVFYSSAANEGEVRSYSLSITTQYFLNILYCFEERNTTYNKGPQQPKFFLSFINLKKRTLPKTDAEKLFPRNKYCFCSKFEYNSDMLGIIICPRVYLII